LRFTVSDTGIGVADDKLSTVFERFTQADSSTTRRFGGSGLGLTISKRLVELMGGHIWAESEVDKGSVFSFAVPFEVWATQRRQIDKPLSIDLDTALRPLRILMAEDGPDNCTIILAYLADTPYQIDVAETGLIACAKFKAQHYDLVLMDRQMPVMDGLTATRALRAWEFENDRQPTPIIALTASALKGDRETCLAAGCTAYLTKPIKQEVLLQAILDYTTPQCEIGQVDIGTGAQSTQPNQRIATLIPIFIERCLENVIAMQKALVQKDFETVTIIGHNLRGSGGGFGFQAITDFGANLEQASQNKNADRIGKLLGELSIYLETLDK
jgi:CheY-like chemotaxis protein/HPt (histidine-containing phosphotransfer) domain-containing protein